MLSPACSLVILAATPLRVQATAAAQERQQLAEERADAEASAKRAQQAQQLAQQRTLELEARVQVGGIKLHLKFSMQLRIGSGVIGGQGS